ncbi:hypothetical protein LO767_13565 [Halopseudomonas aestusnigri]|uniref:hypothetical protein n=1 Tax=Halopseudomonas aestusnigri TaxID=857252 RepID=UPI000C5C0FE8|nr:hypothetical protein [Halopseudomonas aestusnigri]MAD28019.1 hypothetical protein [Pseudomonadales bacterium]MEE2798718.1 hypothetical protein [Pseudomonadota bacterium]HBT58375.1 hypothetical protein [Pseudomonas sp.]MAK74828.1 hypothetical protein [Pseudomonadales bacterium]MAP76852.1 hypothetical protein [Pseudomonadales bacterium]
MVWQLLLTLWVGSVWSLHFVFLPALEQSGLAPLLVDDAALTLRPAVLGISAVAMLLQLFVLVVRVRGAIWRDVRAQVLVLALAAVGAFFLFRGAGNQLLMLMSYLVVAFAGLVLAVQPRPDESAGDR